MLALARRSLLTGTGAPLCQRRALMSAFSQAASTPKPTPARPRAPARVKPRSAPGRGRAHGSGPARHIRGALCAVDISASTATGQDAARTQTKKRPQIRATKAAISVTPAAVERLRGLLSAPTPQLIRIGVRNKGCAGLSYHLEYVDKPGRFDEIVEQDGVRVLIDSKALFSIIGSEMDWVEGRLSSKFAFKNPNIKDACGCGESFTV